MRMFGDICLFSVSVVHLLLTGRQDLEPLRLPELVHINLSGRQYVLEFWKLERLRFGNE